MCERQATVSLCDTVCYKHVGASGGGATLPFWRCFVISFSLATHPGRDMEGHFASSSTDIGLQKMNDYTTIRPSQSL